MASTGSPRPSSDVDARLDPGRFVAFVELNVALDEVEPDGGRRAALRRVLASVEERLDDAAELLKALPGRIGEAMEPFGWLWNGFYVARDGALHLGFAHGPPVCTPLERSGGPLSSGMCFDALALNQTLAAFDTKRWPGYVSCDVASGLQTVSGIVCPVRDPAGRPIAVWDLDATRRITPGDVRFFDVLFATLARTIDLSPDALGYPSR